MEDKFKSIKPNIIFGEEKRTNSLKAYLAEKELKKAVKKNIKTIECHLYNTFKIENDIVIKRENTKEEESYSIIELINDKLTDSKVSVCLETYEIYKEKGIEKAIECLHLKSNLTII